MRKDRIALAVAAVAASTCLALAMLLPTAAGALLVAGVAGGVAILAGAALFVRARRRRRRLRARLLKLRESAG